MDKLIVGSLFSGIGGIDLGLERAGFKIAWQCEIDEYCQKVLAKHWPDVARYGDIRTVGKHNLQAVDLLCGGFPCQDISIAGKRAGITGERSGLWSEFYRLICELRPKYVLVENVPTLLNWGIDTVLGDLAGIGYDAEWQVLSAKAFGAPHLRKRIFIVAYPRCQGVYQRWQFTNAQTEGVKSGRMVSDGLPQRESQQGKIVAYATRKQDRRLQFSEISPNTRAGSEVFRGPIRRRQGDWNTESDVGRVAYGIPSRVDRLKGLGNAVVPQIAEYIGRCILASIEAQEAIA